MYSGVREDYIIVDQHREVYLSGRCFGLLSPGHKLPRRSRQREETRNGDDNSTARRAHFLSDEERWSKVQPKGIHTDPHTHEILRKISRISPPDTLKSRIPWCGARA